MHLLALLGEEAQVDAGSVCLEILLILMQDRCTVCMEHTKCLEINLDAHDGTPKMTCVIQNLALVCLETVLVPVQDRCKACT